MPWLVATALIHSLAVTEKRGAFKRWTVLLALLAFSLSLLGTFLVRSGVLTSVHSFAADPARGLFILVFLCIVIGGSLMLYAWRAPGVSSGGRFDLFCRETLLLGNNLLLVVITAFILLGTLAPLIYDAMGWGKISVGFPWFTTMFVIFTPFLIFIMGLGPLARWKKQDPGDLARQLRIALLLSIAAGVLMALPLLHEGNIWVGLAMALSMWLLSSLALSLRQRWRYRKGIAGILRDFCARGSGSYYGMIIAHFGIAMFIIGVTLVTQFDVEQDIRMSPGQTVELAGHTFRFDGAKAIQGPNYRADRGTIRVFNKGGQEVAVLSPEKRTYLVQTKPMTEAGIDPGFTRDIYVSLGETLGNGDWSLRLYYKPFVRWIWLGGIFIAIGGLLAAADKRYRMARVSSTVPAQAASKRFATEGGA